MICHIDDSPNSNLPIISNFIQKTCKTVHIWRSVCTLWWYNPPPPKKKKVIGVTYSQLFYWVPCPPFSETHKYLDCSFWWCYFWSFARVLTISSQKLKIYWKIMIKNMYIKRAVLLPLDDTLLDIWWQWKGTWSLQVEVWKQTAHA